MTKQLDVKVIINNFGINKDELAIGDASIKLLVWLFPPAGSAQT